MGLLSRGAKRSFRDMMRREEAILDIKKIQSVAAATVTTLGLSWAGVIRAAEALQAIGGFVLVVISISYSLWKWNRDIRKHAKKE